MKNARPPYPLPIEPAIDLLPCDLVHERLISGNEKAATPQGSRFRQARFPQLA